MVYALRLRLRGTGGERAGDTMFQLYIHQRAGSASRPVRQLKGFELGPGAKETVHFALGKDELQFWSPPQKRWVVQPEQFDLW